MGRPGAGVGVGVGVAWGVSGKPAGVMGFLLLLTNRPGNTWGLSLEELEPIRTGLGGTGATNGGHQSGWGLAVGSPPWAQQ